jgi:TRAP-type mannitol/chloroaromatic compound transport system permease large subunit
LGGEDLILTQIITLSEDVNLKLVSILIVLFLLQFLFTWLEISFILVPLLLPVISFLNIDLIWFLVLVCFSFHNLAFFTPFGLNSTSLIGKSANLTVSSYFKNYLPFVCIQIVVLSVVFFNSAFFTIGT